MNKIKNYFSPLQPPAPVLFRGGEGRRGGACGLIKETGDVVRFVVTKFEDMNKIIIPFFNQYSFQGSKGLDFKDLSKVKNLMQNKSHLTQEGLDQIILIKNGMNRGRKHKEISNSDNINSDHNSSNEEIYSKNIKPHLFRGGGENYIGPCAETPARLGRRRLNNFNILNKEGSLLKYNSKFDINSNSHFYEWFVGFADAESNFIINPLLKKDKSTISSFSFMFKITLHLDDEMVLRYINSKLGIGGVRFYKNECIFNVTDQKGIILLISIFDKYNLNTSKHLDYLDFKEAFFIY
jgi:LAGLIDADG endonuclease